MDFIFKEVLLKAKSGDKEARKQLFVKYCPMLKKNAIVDGRYDEDLFQELSKTFLICMNRFSFKYAKENKND